MIISEFNSNQKTVTDFSVFPRSHGFVGTDFLVSFETSTDVHCIAGSMEQYLLQDHHKTKVNVSTIKNAS